MVVTGVSLSSQGTYQHDDMEVPSESLRLRHAAASHEIDGVRKEKERLTAAWTSHTFGLTAHLVGVVAVDRFLNHIRLQESVLAHEFMVDQIFE